MKINKFFLALAAVGVMFAACNEIETPNISEAADGNLVINIKTDLATKSYTDPIGTDTKVTSIQAVVFDASGNYYANITPTGSGSSYSGSLKVPAGNYTVAVVVNGAASYTVSNAATLTALRAITVPLTQNSTTDGTVRYGEAAVTVTAAGGTASVTASNLAFRVTVDAITVSLPAAITAAGGSLSIDAAFLENIYGTCSYSGTITDFSNPGGRVGYGASSAVINGSTAFAPALTYYSGNPAGHVTGFYSYPNAVTSDNFEGPLTSGQTAKARLVIVGTWKQTSSADPETVYYPVTVDAPLAGYSYDITATIAAKGSDDPNKPADNGILGVDITVGNWTAGSDIPAEF